jgi:hypothetical protein
MADAWQIFEEVEEKKRRGEIGESNWLPTPNRPFLAAVRLYNPKPEAWTWKLPPLERQA